MDENHKTSLDRMWMIRFPNGRFARTDDLDENSWGVIQWTTKGGAFDGAYTILRTRSLAGLEPIALQVVGVVMGQAPEQGCEFDLEVHEVSGE